MKLSGFAHQAFITFLSFLISTTYADDINWPELTQKRIIARRSQRDLSANVSIAQLSLTGVALSTTLFDASGYTLDSVSQVDNLLNTGVQTLYIDLYWNEQLNKFQLCPFQYEIDTPVLSIDMFMLSNQSITCQKSLSVNDLTSVILNYIQLSDTNLFGDLIVMILNIRHLNNSSISYSNDIRGNGNDTLTSIMTNYFGNYIYTPLDLESDRTNDVNATSIVDGYPRLSKFLFTDKRRLVTMINEYEIPLNSKYNASNDSSLFFNMTQLNTSVQSVLETSLIQSRTDIDIKSNQNWRFTIDFPTEFKFTTQSAHDVITNGYSPIINHTLANVSNVSDIYLNSLWSWGENEPLTVVEALAKFENETTFIQEAFKCTSMTLNGTFQVSNCYEEKYVILRDVNSRFNWTLSPEKINYFQSANFDDASRKFSVPKDALERAAAVIFLESIDNIVLDDVWIDLNSINVNNCWVTGGPYASCPYEIVSTKRNFVEMITAPSVCCLIILFLITMLRLRAVPIRDNKKHWKKLINQYSANDYEGVPA